MRKRRRTMLYCPASNPKLYNQAPVYEPDCIIFDLEDSVKLQEKDAARDLLIEAMKALEFGNIEIIVRVNGVKTPYFRDDVRAVIEAGIEHIRLPMCETAADVQVLDKYLTELECAHNFEIGQTKIHIGIETPKGVINAIEIAAASSRNVVMSFGAEDYTASLGINRTKKGDELLYARSTIINVASAFGLDAVDTVWADFKDVEGFKKEVDSVKSLGYRAKSCIHPSQIEIIHDIFKPSVEEVKKSKKILDAVSSADIEAGGVISLDGKMIDVPVITKARKIMEMYEGRS